MARVFAQHFRGTYKCPKSINQLPRCTQNDNEAYVDFISCWTTTKNSCSGVSDTQAMNAFMNNLKPGLVPFMVGSKSHTVLGSMLTTADEHAAAEDDIRARGGDIDAIIQSKKESHSKKKATTDAMEKPKEVNVVFGRDNQNKWKSKSAEAKKPINYSKEEWEKIRGELCTHHARFGKPNHTNQQCRLNKHMRSSADAGNKGQDSKRKFNKQKPDAKTDASESDMDQQIQEQQWKGEPKFPRVDEECNLTFLATPSAKKLKQAMREINATVPPTPKYLKYAKTPITWDQSDHPDNIPEPGTHALIVSPVVQNHRLKRVLMDGGPASILCT